MGMFPPASAGLIYDDFAEYEKTFSTARLKHKTMRLAPPDRKNSDLAASSILQSTRVSELSSRVSRADDEGTRTDSKSDKLQDFHSMRLHVEQYSKNT